MNIKDITILTTLLLIFSNLVIAAEDITGEATYGTIEFSKHCEKLSAVEPTKFLANNEEFDIREIWINVNTETENSVFKLIKLPYRPETIKKTETISENPAKIKTFDKAGWIISFLLLLTLIYIFYQKNNKINHQKHKLN